VLYVPQLMATLFHSALQALERGLEFCFVCFPSRSEPRPELVNALTVGSRSFSASCVQTPSGRNSRIHLESDRRHCGNFRSDWRISSETLATLVLSGAAKLCQSCSNNAGVFIDYNDGTLIDCNDGTLISPAA
jgi:hypothetical protein